MKAAVRLNQNHAGVYATVIRTGRLAVGQPIYLVDAAGVFGGAETLNHAIETNPG